MEAVAGPDAEGRRALPALKVESYHGADGLAAVRTEWAELARRDRCGHFQHFPEWLGTALEYAPTVLARTRFFLFRDGDGRCRALLPLERCSGQWQVPRDEQTSYIDLVADGEATAREALRLLPRAVVCHGGGRIRLDRVLEGGNALVAGSGARVEPVPGKCSDWLALAGGSQGVFEAAGRHFRKELRRKRRRAEEGGTLHFRIDRAGETDESARRDAFEAFLALEAGGWKGAGGTGTAIDLDPRLRAFYEAVMEATEAGGGLCWRLHRLFLDERCIAAQLGVEARDTVYLLKIAYDEEYAGASPGLLAIAELLERLDAEPHVQWLTFVTGGRHQDVWRPRALGVFSALLYTPGPRGRLAYVADRGRAGMRRLRRGLAQARERFTKQTGAGH